MATCSEVLVRLLASYGVDTVFGIPGVHTVELYRGLHGSSIRHVSPRHEQGAGFMADGYARASGRVGVCFVITGPGVTNIATAMGQAYADSIPMLIISSVGRRHELRMRHGCLHELQDQRNLTAGVAAFSHTLMRPDELPEALARAFTVFSSSRPRPVHIEIPLDVLTAPADHIEMQARPLPNPPGPAAPAIAEAARLIRGARRIVVLAGGGAVNASKELATLAERIGSPVALTSNARGLLSPTHPLLLDGVQSMAAGRELISEADLIMAVGTELGQTDYDIYERGPLQFEAPLVRIDIDPMQVTGAYPAQVGIVSDVGLALAMLLGVLHDLPARDGEWGRGRVREVNADARAGWSEDQYRQSVLLDTVRDILSRPIIVGDSTQPVYQGTFSYRAPSPRSWFNSATGYGTLGYGLPAAIGAKLAQPERPVVALVGDGSVQFTLPELIVAREVGANIIVLVWNNHGYGEIRDYMESRNIEPIGVDIRSPDFQLVAKSMGVAARRVTSKAVLATVLDECHFADEPVLIELDSSLYS